MAARRSTPRRRTRNRSSDGPPVGVVVLVTLFVGAGIGAVGYHFLRRQAHVPLQRTLPGVTPGPARTAPQPRSQPQPKPAAPKGPAPGLPAATQFDFYTILPEIHHRHPSGHRGVFPHARHLPASGATTKPVFALAGQYVIQAASFPDTRDARRLVAKLAQHRLAAYIERVSISGRGTFYRVRLGPLRAGQIAGVRTILGHMRLQPIVLKEAPGN